MPTLSDLIQTTHRRLTPTILEQRNTLGTNYTAGATFLTTTNPPSGIRAGVTLSVDLELFYVTDDPTGLSVPVIGGQQGSAPSNHTSGATVVINPKFSDFDIAGAINDDLADLCSPECGLFQVRSVDLTFNPAIAGYDLTGVTSLIDVYSVRYKIPGPSQYWPKIKRSRWQLVRNQTDSAFPSGYALFLYDGAYPGLPIHVEYKAPFGTLVNLTDDAVTTAGLPATAVDLPPIGAAIALSVGREIKRNFTESQADPRRAAEVPPGAVANAPAGLIKRRIDRISHEASRLAAAYPLEMY